MDEFTQNMLERAKLRRQKLNSHMSQAGVSRPVMPLQPNNSLNIDKGASNSTESQVTEVKPGTPSVLSSSAKSKLQQLGDLYSENYDALSSPIHRTEDKIITDAPKQARCVKLRLGRLNELASCINQWEDDLSHPDVKKKPEKPKPSVTKFTKTETKLTESTVSTTITMTTINKGNVNATKQTTATIFAGGKASEDAEGLKKSKLDDAQAEGNENIYEKEVNGQKITEEGKMWRVTGARSSKMEDYAKVLIPKQKQSHEPTQTTLESQALPKTNEPIGESELEKINKKTMSPTIIPQASGTYRKSSVTGKPPKCSSPYKKSQAPAPPAGNYKKSSLSSKKSIAPAPPGVGKHVSPQRLSSPFKKNSASPSRSPKMGVSSLEKESSVLKRAAMFEAQHSSPVKARDPAELSLAERKALFEKNKGEVLLPKVAFATSLPAKKNSPPKIKNSPAKVAKTDIVKPKTNHEKAVSSIKEKFEQDLVETTNKNMSQLEREKDLEFLRNRWNKNKTVHNEEITEHVPVAPPMPPTCLSPITVTQECMFKNTTSDSYKDSPEALRAVQGVKKIMVSPPKKGKLYPSLSDIEVGDDSASSSSSPSFNDSKHSNIYLNMSFGDILEASKNIPQTPPRTQESAVLNEMDELLDAALGDVSSSDDDGPTPPKMTRNPDSGATTSNSFEFERGSPRKSIPTTPLVHTVSFYRKQQNCLSTPGHTPLKVIKRTEVTEKPEVVEDESLLVKKRIEELMVEVAKQQTVISQASNLLSVCMANIEFSGSGEQVEGERLLLLAGHKRQACLHEVERLKVEGTLRPCGPNSDQLRDQGDLVIRKIAIPLKRETLRSMAADESMQYFVCLIKSDERVLATSVVSATSQNLQGTTLTVPGELHLERLYSDFKVTVEVYHMVLSRELLPHHIKYHLPGKKDKKLLTPIKNKKSQSRLVMPNMQSPAGPNAVRSTNFSMCGYVIFSLREVRRTQWTLNKVPYTSPVEGSMSMQIACSLQMDDEHRGFLAMFDDVSGLGAWHRRWCLLSSHTLSYWKYPDDENKKVPLGSLDLRSVVTDTVGLVSRDICARLHTFLMETTRPREPQDYESLVLVLDGEVARIRHLLSADTKEERIEWCTRLNKALALIRAWNCQV